MSRWGTCGHSAPSAGQRALYMLLDCVAFVGYAAALDARSADAGLAGLHRVASDGGGITILAPRPDDPTRMLVGSKEGLIRTLDLETGAFEPDPFLNLLGEVDAEGEGGLAGFAFHPDFATNGKFYITVTVDNGGIPVDPMTDPAILSPFSAQVRAYTLSENPQVADLEYVNVLSWVKPQTSHSGGWLGFSPLDGKLYIATGDGGGYDDVLIGHTPGLGNSQDLTDNWMGKVLRIDVDTDAFPDDDTRNYDVPADNPYVGIEGDDEIFAYGLRHPWRASFDRATGDLWIGDVGENSREEVNFLPASSDGEQNYGWRLREGSAATPGSGVGGDPPADHVPPVYDYVHTHLDGDPPFEGNSVTGGFLYRGPDPELQGKYLFADFVSGQFWMFDPASPYATVTNVTSLLAPDAGTANLPTTFTQDAVGNLYVATITGNVFRIVTDALTPGDFQADAAVDELDLAIWQQYFGEVGDPGELAGDADGDGAIGGADFLAWQASRGWSALVLPPPDSASVPEPGAQMLALVCALFLSVPTRRIS